MVCCPLMRMVACEIATARPRMHARMIMIVSSAPSNSRFAGRFEWMYSHAANNTAVEPMSAASKPITSLMRITCSPFQCHLFHSPCLCSRQSTSKQRLLSLPDHFFMVSHQDETTTSPAGSIIQ